MKLGDAAIRVRDAIADSCARADAPLSDDQKRLLVGALAIWLDWWALQVEKERRAASGPTVAATEPWVK